MAHAVTHGHRVVPLARQCRREDDALDAMRGIIFGTLLSVLGFWIPLLLAVTMP